MVSQEDYITWMMQICPGPITSEDLVSRLLSVHMASIDTTGIVGTMVTFHLAARPQYISPLREEVVEMIGAFGWSKEAMDKCVKLNSFIREATRFNPITLSTLSPSETMR
jgi:cytochrome P450